MKQCNLLFFSYTFQKQSGNFEEQLVMQVPV